MKFEKVADEGVISGYITKFGEVDSYGTCTVAGCFQSAVDRMNNGETIPVLWQHDPHDPIGKFAKLKEDDIGYYADIKLDLNVSRAREAFSLIKNDIVSGLSIAGVIKKITFSTDEDEPDVMNEIDLWETSVVTFPACDGARIDDCRENKTNIREMEHAFKKSGLFSQTDSKKLAKFFCSIVKENEPNDATTAENDPSAGQNVAEVQRNEEKMQEKTLGDLLNTLKSFKL